MRISIICIILDKIVSDGNKAIVFPVLLLSIASLSQIFIKFTYGRLIIVSNYFIN